MQAPAPVTARSAVEGLPRVHYDFMFDPKDMHSYKFMSLHAAIPEIKLAGDCAQFGVYSGRCARFLAAHMPRTRRLFLFDSFEGLPEDWTGQYKKGAFSLDEVPQFEAPQIRIIKGWFKNTVPTFAAILDQPLAFIHMDADLYSSTMDVLTNLNSHISAGTVILFDEYFLIEAGKEYDDEHRALLDYCAKFGRKFEYLWRTRHVQVAIKITG